MEVPHRFFSLESLRLEALGGLVEEPGQVLAQALAEWLHAFVAAASRLMNLMGRF